MNTTLIDGDLNDATFVKRLKCFSLIGVGRVQTPIL